MKIILVACVLLAILLQEHTSRASVCNSTTTKQVSSSDKYYKSCGWWGWSRCASYRTAYRTQSVTTQECCTGSYGHPDSGCSGECEYKSDMPSNRCSGKVCRGFTCDRSGSAAPQVDISDDKRDANNNDAWKLLEVNATCFVDFTCPTCACDCQDRKKRAVAAVGEEGELLKKFDRVRRAAGCLCSKNVPCSTCSVSNTAMFEVKNGKEIWRKPCSTKCRDCSGQPGCFDNGETYKTTVTCSAAGYDVNDEVELPEEVVLLVRSVDPPAVAFPESDGTVTARWLDPVGRILATPDFEFPGRKGDVKYSLTGTISTTSGEELFAFNETSGSIEVIADLSLEESADYNLTLCVETRRHNVCAFLVVSFLGEPEEPYCSAIGAWADVPHMDSWCQLACKHSTPYCPPTHCKCSDEPDPDRHYCTPVHPWSTVIGMVAWCDWTCNDPEWKNVTCLNSYCACVPPVFTISEAAP